jgi:thiol-disulfide isomerase/thioredoxin
MNTLFALLALSFLPSAYACDDANKVYKVCSDQVKSYESGVKAAKAEHKMLVLVMGAEWCPWCMSMHTMFRENKTFSGDFASKYRLGDVAMYDGKKKLPSGETVLKKLQKAANDFDKKKVEGIPVLAMVNPVTGKAALIGTEALEQNTKDHKGHDPAKVLAALDAAAESLR